MTKIAVTGGSGKAGRAVVRDLLEQGHQVLNVDQVPSAESSSPDSPAPFLYADLTDYGQTLEAISGGERLPGIEAVVHLAAIPSPVVATPDLTFRTNITSTYTVFAAARAPGASSASCGHRARRRSASRSTPRRTTPRSTRSTSCARVLLRALQGPRRGDGAPVSPLVRHPDPRPALLERHGGRRLPALPGLLGRTRSCASGTSGATSTSRTWPQSVRLALEADVAGARVLHHRRRRHGHEAPESRADGRGLPRSAGPRRRRWHRHPAQHRQGPARAGLLAGLHMEGALLMDQVRLGATGLHVSRVCLGMMSYGNRLRSPVGARRGGGRADHPPRGRGGHHLLRQRRRLLPGRQRGRHRALVSKFLARDEAVIATKVHGQMTPGPNGRGLSRKHVLAAIDASLQRLGHRPRRPLPDPPLGSADPDRGDDGGAARHRAGGQGALHRRQQHARLAVRQGAARRRAPRLDALRLDAEPRQPPLP